MSIQSRLDAIQRMLLAEEFNLEHVLTHMIYNQKEILEQLMAISADDQKLLDAFNAFTTQQTESNTVIQEALARIQNSSDPVVASIADKLSAAVAASQPALDALKAAVETTTGAPATPAPAPTSDPAPVAVDPAPVA